MTPLQSQHKSNVIRRCERFTLACDDGAYQLEAWCLGKCYESEWRDSEGECWVDVAEMFRSETTGHRRKQWHQDGTSRKE